jgi:hypothetical protein
LPIVVHDLPFHSSASSVTLAEGESVTVANHQIILWVSVSPVGLDEHPPEARPFPAVLDTGFNHGFLLQERHFQAWSGYDLRSNQFPVHGDLRVYRAQAKLYEADLWIHRNVRGRRDQLSAARPFRLELDLGIAISPSPDQPRLPLIGLMAIEMNRLKALVDGAKQHVTLRT